MNKLMTVAAAAALLTASSFVAFAAQVTGSIMSMDVAAGTITLDNRQTYQVAPEQKMDLTASNATPAVFLSFKAGDKVVIRFEVVGGTLEATSVAPVKM